MMKSFVFAVALAALTASTSVVATRPAAAADATAPLDCSQAESMFTDAVKSHVASLTGDVDKDFAAIVVDHEKATAMIMKIEAQCGKDPKMKAMAAKQAADSDARMALFRNQNMSQ